MIDIIKLVLAEIATAIIMQRHNDKTNRKEWALVSKKPDKRTRKHKVLYWFGTKKPSKEKVLKQERRVQYFKHA